MSGAEFPLHEIVQNAIDRHSLAGWTLREQAFWCQVSGPVRQQRIQGWKLHLSATMLSAPIILQAAAEVLLTAGCQFKFAKSLSKVEELTSVRYERAQAGKFIAAYPGDEEEFHRLAAELCEATIALPGPRILSDRPYRPGSIVQYRFGAFAGIPTLTNDGCFEARLRAPDGSVVPDVRKPWFAPPPWANPIAPPAVPVAVAAASSPATPIGVGAAPATKPARPRLADGRYEIMEAIRHSARGGVYRAVDTTNDATVIIKEARAHIGARRDGVDSRALLRHEADVLDALAPLTPAVLGVFEKNDHVFLVEEYLDGRPLAEHIAGSDIGCPNPAMEDQLWRLALEIVTLVQGVHDRGWVLRDISSMNIMVTADRGLVLIDPEYAARSAATVARTYTPASARPKSWPVRCTVRRPSRPRTTSQSVPSWCTWLSARPRSCSLIRTPAGNCPTELVTCSLSPHPSAH